MDGERGFVRSTPMPQCRKDRRQPGPRSSISDRSMAWLRAQRYLMGTMLAVLLETYWYLDEILPPLR